MKNLTALVLAAGLAFSAGTAANAMTDDEIVSRGHSMMIGALYNSLQTHGYPTEGIEKLTLNELARLNHLLSTNDDTGRADGQVKVIFERAKTR